MEIKVMGKEQLLTKGELQEMTARLNIRFHKGIAENGRWFEFSYNEQMGNIGSEVGRAAKWQGKDEERFDGAVNRALELFDLTLEDPRWKKQKRLFEISRARELFCRAVEGDNEYKTTLHDLDNYFLPFAFAARRNM